MKRTYTNTEREAALAALAANAGNINLTASQLAIPEATMRSWAKGTRSPEAQKMYEPRGRDMAAAIERVAWRLIKILPKKLGEAKLSAVAAALAVCIDKLRLLRNQTTVISAGRRAEGERPGLSGLTSDELADLERLLRKALDDERPGTA